MVRKQGQGKQGQRKQKEDTPNVSETIDEIKQAESDFQAATSQSKQKVKRVQKLPFLKHDFNSQCRPSTPAFKRPVLNLNGKTCEKDVEQSILNGRYFYQFAIYSDNWTLFVFDSFRQQSFTFYDASSLGNHFRAFDFHYVPYDFDYGLVYDDDKIVKIQLDHETKKLKVIGRPFKMSMENVFAPVFEIHTVQIIKNDVVMIYACAFRSSISQRLYLRKWSDLSEIKMCRIGIRDGLRSVQMVSAQFVKENQLCLIHRQDKERQFGSVIPLVLFWDTEGEIKPEKFMKLEYGDGKPFVQKLRAQSLTDKTFTGAWHGHLFSMLISRYLPNSKRNSTSLIVFNGLTRIWTPLFLPEIIGKTRQSLFAFFNTSHFDDDTKLIFYSKNGKSLKIVHRMPVKTPDTLEDLCQIRASQIGIFDVCEKIKISELDMEREMDLLKKEQLRVKEHQAKVKNHQKLVKGLKDKQKKMRKRDISGKLLPPVYSDF